MDYLALQVVHYALTTQRLDRYYCQSRTGKAVERLSGNFQVAYVSISFERALPFDGHGSGVCERHRELHGSVLAEIIYFGPSETEDLASVYFLVRLKFAWDQVRLAEDTDSTSVYDTDIDVRSVSTEHIFCPVVCSCHVDASFGYCRRLSIRVGFKHRGSTSATAKDLKGMNPHATAKDLKDTNPHSLSVNSRLE